MTTRGITRRIVRTPRRARQWAIAPVAGGTIVAATHAGMLTVPLMSELETDLGMELNNVTASAIRLNVTYRLATAMSTDDTTVAMGILWATNRAIAAGGVALPDPSQDHADWMFHDIRTLVGESGTDQDSHPRNGFLEIRNNSMRKQRVMPLVVI